MPSRVTVLVALAMAASASAVEHRDRVTRVLPARDGTVVEIACTIGTVSISGSSRTDVSVAIVRRVPGAADLERVPVSIDPAPDRIVVRAEQRDAGTDPALAADVTVDMPARLAAEARLFEGSLRVAGLRHQVTGTIRRGPIAAERLEGTIRLETGIGDLALRDARLTPGGLIRLRTFNGNVHLSLRERPANARILALSLGGRVTSDIPLTTRTTFGPRFGETTIGSGEPLISLDAVNGDIRIESR